MDIKVQKIKDALRLITASDDASKLDGLSKLRQILAGKDVMLSEFGYNQLIFKELIKLVQFEVGDILESTLCLLEDYYFNDKQTRDELMENLIYRVGRTNDVEVCMPCLQKTSSLIDFMGDEVAKHSKQLLKLIDLDTTEVSKSLSIEILEKLEKKLPIRRIPES